MVTLPEQKKGGWFVFPDGFKCRGRVNAEAHARGETPAPKPVRERPDDLEGEVEDEEEAYVELPDEEGPELFRRECTGGCGKWVEIPEGSSASHGCPKKGGKGMVFA